MEIKNYVIRSDERELLTKFKDEIGQKALGLYDCDIEFIPKFIIISSTLFKKWVEDEDIKKVLEGFQHLASDYFAEKELIIRSSAKIETCDERGFYESSLGKVKISNIYTEVLKVWETNKPFVNSFPDNHFSIIVQEYIEPKYLGHLSNERRLNENNNSWYYEILNPDGSYFEGNFITANEIGFDKLNPTCHTKSALTELLYKIASNNSMDRFHIEWVWDGMRIWLVQKDKEQKINVTYGPGSEWKGRLSKIVNTQDYPLECLKTVKTTNNTWNKVKCIETFIECNLSFGEVYILEGSDLLYQILDGVFSDSLKKDLLWLLTSPIVIRMDIKGEKGNRTLLPRTETLQNFDDVKGFISSNLKKFKSEDVPFDDICFLLHRFIISKSCAFALSKPRIPRARIDSTWGIVDGLYFHPHDSFEVQKSKKFISHKRIRCKTEYLDIDSVGHWISRKCGEDYDWKESLSTNELKKILEYNEKIASHLNKEVTVMYFVGIFKETGYPSILPWFYSTEEIPDSSEKFTDTVFSGKRILISDISDFNALKDKFDALKTNNRISIVLKLKPELLREREFIEKIGEFSEEKKIPIILEGSILSHPYYILRKQHAIVQVRNPFEPSFSKQSFYKLVRDKIPIQIESKGESAKVLKITPEQTLELIKQKIIEEAFEFFWEYESDNLMEELADLYELIRSASRIFSSDIDEINKIADNKREKKGGFESGTFLIETQEKSLIEMINGIKDSKLEMEEDYLNNFIMSQIPRHKGSSYANEIISISYIPSLLDKKTKKRIEIVGSSIKDDEYIIEYTKSKIIIKPYPKIKASDSNQLELPFD